MTGRGIFVVSLLAGASPAQAWEVVAQISIRLTIEVSSKVSIEASCNASSEGSRRHERAEESAQNETAAEAPQARACSSDEACDDGQRCVRGQCDNVPPVPPPEPPPEMLLRRGSELYLREHAAQLRQDVALGDGPVIATLSSIEKVPRATLGRAMRAHHRELLELIGDGADDVWPGRFFRRVSELARPAVTGVVAPPRSRGS